MTLEELRALATGDRVQSSRGRTGTVVGAGVGGTGHHYAQVEWDDFAPDDYRRYSRFSADWAGATHHRRLRRVGP